MKFLKFERRHIFNVKDHRSSVHNQHTKTKQNQKNNRNKKKTNKQQQQQRQNCKPKTKSKTKSVQAAGLNGIRTYDSLSFRPSLGVRRENILEEGEGGGGEVSLPSLSPLIASFFAFSPRNSLYSC